MCCYFLISINDSLNRKSAGKQSPFEFSTKLHIMWAYYNNNLKQFYNFNDAIEMYE